MKKLIITSALALAFVAPSFAQSSYTSPLAGGKQISQLKSSQNGNPFSQYEMALFIIEMQLYNMMPSGIFNNTATKTSSSIQRQSPHKAMERVTPGLLK